MAAHWFIWKIESHRTITGELFIAQSDIPCHLWMRWTNIPPKIHRISVKRRGIIIRTDLYFCFDVYEDNEQEEPGDTLIHTFIKEPWLCGESRWYYFHGEIAGIPSKSSSATFFKHPAPPCTPLHYHTYHYSIVGPNHELAQRVSAAASVCPAGHPGCKWQNVIVQEAIIQPDNNTSSEYKTPGHTHTISVPWPMAGNYQICETTQPCALGHPNCRWLELMWITASAAMQDKNTAAGTAGYHRHSYQIRLDPRVPPPIDNFWIATTCPSAHPQCQLIPTPTFTRFYGVLKTGQTSYDIEL